MKKNAFTFFELLIVIVLILGVYSLFFTNFNKKVGIEKSEITLVNLKTNLVDNFQFSNTLRLSCIEEGDICYVFVDENISKDNMIQGLFKTKPDVYKYMNTLDRLEFKKIRFENLEEYEVCFEYKINKDRKSNEMIVSYDDKVYVYNAINDKPLILKYLNEVSDIFDKRIQEVKDAF